MPVYPSERYAPRSLFVLHFTKFDAPPAIVAAANEAEAKLLGNLRVGTVACVAALTAETFDNMYGPDVVATLDPISDFVTR